MPSREARFRTIFDAGYGPVSAYARRRVRAADVDDLVAEVFAVAWRRLEVVPDGERALPWLYGTARRVLANRRRAEGRRHRLLERLRSEPDRHAAPPVSEDGDDALAALVALRSEDQEVLRLAAWEGLRAADIGLVLGCSPNAAALRLSRARRRLRAALTEMAVSRTRAGMEWFDG